VEVRAVADGVHRSVRVLDGWNRRQFARGYRLETRVCASTVLGKPKRGEVVVEAVGEGVPGGDGAAASGEEVRPAA
jgi:hypothetical protein